MPERKDDPGLADLGPVAWLIPLAALVCIMALVVIVGVGLKARPWAPKSAACFVIQLEDQSSWWVCPAGKAEHA